MQASKKLHVPKLSATEWKVAMRWFGPRITMFDVLLGRKRSQSGRCFVVIDGGRAHG